MDERVQYVVSNSTIGARIAAFGSERSESGLMPEFNRVLVTWRPRPMRRVLLAVFGATAVGLLSPNVATAQLKKMSDCDLIGLGTANVGVDFFFGPNVRIVSPVLNDASWCYGAIAGNDNAVPISELAEHWSGYGPWSYKGKSEGNGSSNPFLENTSSGGNYANRTHGVLNLKPDQAIDGVFAITLKGGSQYSVYLLESVNGPVTSINFEMSGVGTQPPGLSHASLYVAGNNGPPDFSVVPEPASIALMGVGLIGLAVTARRRRR